MEVGEAIDGPPGEGEDDMLGEHQSDLEVAGVPALRGPQTPTEKEYEEHCVSHTPYRAWCRHCVAGRGKDKRHEEQQRDLSGIPCLVVDYTFLGDRSDVQEIERSTVPVLVCRDRRTQWGRCRSCP